MSQQSAPRLHIAGPLLTIEQAAALLGVSGSTLRQRVQAGHLKSFRRGRKLFTTRKWVEQYRAERHRKPGRPRAASSLEDQYAGCVAGMLHLDLPASFEEVDDPLFQAARRLVAGHPRASDLNERQLEEVIARYRAVLVDGEPAAHRQAAVQAIIGRLGADPLVVDARFRAGRCAARAHPTELGRRWQARFRDRLAALTVDPRIPGSIARLDVVVACEVAEELSRAQPALRPGELFAAVAQAMLEGSENLPDGPQECRAAIEAIVDEALGQGA
jgi:excisionase family DNA binding protein